MKKKIDKSLRNNKIINYFKIFYSESPSYLEEVIPNSPAIAEDIFYFGKNAVPKYVKPIQALSTPPNFALNFAQVFSGYFKAPISSRYRFFIASDDKSQVMFSCAPGEASREKLVEIAKVSSWVSYRNYYAFDEQISDWIDLDEGKFYFMEIRHIDTGGDSNFQMAVEIDYNKPNLYSGYVIKRLDFSFVFKPLIFSITINNFDPWNSMFQLQVKDETTGAITTGDSTSFKLDINEIKKNMAAFFKVDAANIVASMAFTNENKQSVPNYWKGVNCVINATINRPWDYHPWKPYLVDSLIINSPNSIKEIKFTILQQQSDHLGGGGGGGARFFKRNSKLSE